MLKVPEGSRWKIVEVLRHWTNNKQFGADDGDWKKELQAWSRWYAQSFPKEPALPDTFGDKPAESKYKFADLLTLIEKEPKGDPVKGKAAFAKALCIKCHKYGNEGEGIGPDLSTVSKRFKRSEVLEALYYPSKVISDQYRSTTLETLNGIKVTGLVSEQGDTFTILLSDGMKTTLKRNEIENRYASLVSVMPEKLLDLLSEEEIRDLFAYTESEVPLKK